MKKGWGGGGLKCGLGELYVRPDVVVLVAA